MSLQLSCHKPRLVQYAAGGLRSDFRLLELDDSLLQSIKHGNVVIKGDPQDDAVLCTSDKTFALKLVETTNTLLLMPPQQDLDEQFAAIPSLPTPGRSQDSSSIKDVGLQTQLQKSAAATDFPPLTATATAGAHLELVEVLPCLDQLPQLLGRPYSQEDEDAEQQAEHGSAVGTADVQDDVMEVDPQEAAAAGPGSRRLQAQHLTLEQLLQRVQASRAELLAELQRLQALQLGPYWRLVDPQYLGTVLEMLLVSATEKGWDVREPLQLQAVVAALQPDGYSPAVIEHCLKVFGCLATDSPASAAPAPSSPADSSSYVLDARRVCLHYARKLFQRRAVWLLHDFMVAWQQELPSSIWRPQQDMLLGEALLLLPDPTEGYSEPRLLYLPANRLPSAPAARFAALFAAQPRWTREQLDPYLDGLKVPGQTVEMLLLKYARASQRSSTDSTVVFVAR